MVFLGVRKKRVEEKTKEKKQSMREKRFYSDSIINGKYFVIL